MSRIVLLCEDRLHESLVRRFCDAHGSRLERVFVAPKARGAASAWVLAQYPARVAEFRSRANAQPQLALLVMIDGDNVGLVERKRELDGRLQDKPRRQEERILIWAPTWSVETWIRALRGEPVDETKSYKGGDSLTFATASDGAAFHKATRAEFASTLPSLADGVNESERLP
jgi:hypothetical protein